MDSLQTGSLFRRAIICILIIAGVALFAGDNSVVSAARRVQASPAGEIAYGQDGQIWIMDVGSGQTRQLTSTFGDVNGKPRWSPDGEWVAFWSVSPGDGNFDIYKARADGSQMTRVTSDSRIEVLPAYSSDGSLYFLRMDASRLQQAIGDGTLDKLLAGMDYSIIKVDPSGQETTLRREQGGPCAPVDMSVAADGQITLSTFCLDVTDFMHPIKMGVSLLDTQSDSSRDVGGQYLEAQGCYSGGRWAHGSRRMALVELAGCDLLKNSSMLRVLDLANGDSRRLYSGDLDITVAPDWSPDDQWLAYVGGNGLWAISAQGGSPQRLVSGQGIGSLAWRPAAISISDVPTPVPTVAAKTYSISGQVLDVNDGPIPDVTVSDGKGHNATSDQDGKYTLSGLEPGEYRLEATKRGYTFGLYPPSEQASYYDEDAPTNPTPVTRRSYDVTVTDRDVVGPDFAGYDKEPIVFVHGWHGAGHLWQLMGLGTNCTDNMKVEDFNPSDHDLRRAGYMTYHVKITTSQCNTPKWEENAPFVQAMIQEALAETHQSKAIVVAHSMGGLVTRAYIDNWPVFSKDGKPVSQLFTFGTLHHGVPLAFLSHGIPNYCDKQPGACDFSPSATARFNKDHPIHPKSVTYHMVGGKTPLLTRRGPGIADWLSRVPSDGAVPLYSSRGEFLVGDVDRFTTDEAHSTSVGKYTYFNKRGNEPSHSYVQCLYWVLLKGNERCSKEARLDSGQFKSTVSSSRTLSLNSPATSLAQEESQVAQSPFFNGTLTSGQQAAHTVTVGGGQAMFAVYWLTGTLSLTLVDPGGQRIDPQYAASHSGEVSYTAEPGSVLYSFSKAAAGAWQLEVRGENAPAQGAEYSAYAAFASDLTLTTTTDRPWYAPGSTANISATLAGALSSSGAEVTATVLHADGGNDTVSLARQSDGHYQGSYTVPSAAGYIEVRVTAKGTSANNAPFELGDLIAFQVQTASFALSGVYEAHKEDCAEGASYATLLYMVGVKSTNGGRVGLSADLVDEQGNQVAHSYVTSDIPPGGGSVTLRFGGEEIATSQHDGPFKLTNLLLTSKGDTSLVAAEAQNVATTQAFKFADFVCSAGLNGPGTTKGATQDMSIVALLLFGGVALLGLAALGLVLSRARRGKATAQPGMSTSYQAHYPGGTQSLPLVRPSAPAQPTSVMPPYPPPSSNQAPTHVYGVYGAPTAQGASGMLGVPPTYNSRPPIPNQPPPPFPARPAPPMPRTSAGMNAPSGNYPAPHPNMKAPIQPPPLRAVPPAAQPEQGAGGTSATNVPVVGISPPPPPPRPQAQPMGHARVLCANCGRALNVQTRQCDSCGWKAP